MKVRAKFMCHGVNNLYTIGDGVCAIVTMAPVYGDGADNAEWSKWTPQGKLEMTITNPTAIEAFNLGKAYFLEFTPEGEPVSEALSPDPRAERAGEIRDMVRELCSSVTGDAYLGNQRETDLARQIAGILSA